MISVFFFLLFKLEGFFIDGFNIQYFGVVLVFYIKKFFYQIIYFYFLIFFSRFFIKFKRFFIYKFFSLVISLG